MLFQQLRLYLRRQAPVGLFRAPATVEQENAAVLQLGYDIIFFQEGLIVAGISNKRVRAELKLETHTNSDRKNILNVI